MPLASEPSPPSPTTPASLVLDTDSAGVGVDGGQLSTPYQLCRQRSRVLAQPHIPADDAGKLHAGTLCPASQRATSARAEAQRPGVQASLTGGRACSAGGVGARESAGVRREARVSPLVLASGGALGGGRSCDARPGRPGIPGASVRRRCNAVRRWLVRGARPPRGASSHHELRARQDR